MENHTLSEIICILDRSGSMQVLQQETIGGLNEFIREQKQVEGNCNFTFVQFNQETKAIFTRKPIKEVKELTLDSYKPEGYTALLDAVGITLQSAIETLFYLPAEQTPKKVLVFIITDGQENASHIYSKQQVKKMIQNLTSDKGWEFRFYGANVDAFGEAGGIGISADKAAHWNYSKDGVGKMMQEMSLYTKEFRAKDKK